MKQQRKLLQRIADKAVDTGEPIAGIPLVELAGDRRVLIEHHQGVLEYGLERICVRLRYGQLNICGTSLRLACMTKQQLVITGRIDSLHLTRTQGGKSWKDR